MRRSTASIGILSAILFLCLGGALRADDYYVAVFGAESSPKRPKFSHSWASFVRLACDGTCEVITISWMPAALEIHPNRLWAEPGVNLDLPTTIQEVLAHCETIMAWGPYRIDCELFERARKHQCRLTGGELNYKTIEPLRNTQRNSNCIHALTVFNTENRRLRIGRTNFGHTASYAVTKTYEKWIICDRQPECGIIDLLGLADSPILWRTIAQGRPRGNDN